MYSISLPIYYSQLIYMYICTSSEKRIPPTALTRTRAILKTLPKVQAHNMTLQRVRTSLSTKKSRIHDSISRVRVGRGINAVY